MKKDQVDCSMYVENPSDILSKAVSLAHEGRYFALITSVEIKGGAAREVGSLAIVDTTGRMTGYLSNGCIDRDIQLQAQGALKVGKKRLVRYGEGSRFADLKLPCGGALTILIDPAPDMKAISEAADGLMARKTVSISFEVLEDIGTSVCKKFKYFPRPRLVVAGRGAIFQVMANIAANSGYDVHLLSPETEDLAVVGHLSGESPVHLTTPDSCQNLISLDAYSAFLTLFHDHDWEPTLLKAALKTPACFIGSLGSYSAHSMRLNTLRKMGVSEASLSRLRGPIGLVPSLRDASSIALSALAEIVAAFHGIDETSPSEQNLTF